MTDRGKKEYMHGYSQIEQKRLFDQARFLESYVHGPVDFSQCKKIVEIGSGVGAQTAILLDKFPDLEIDCVDISDQQIKTAKNFLRKHGDRVKFFQGDANTLPFKENIYDGAFICWFLEHVKQPVEVLRETARVLKSGARLYCNEVLNSSLFIDPYSASTLQYLFALNDHQWGMGGDPFVGAKLGNILSSAGFQNVHTQVCTVHFDNRAPKMRAQMIEYWAELLESASVELVKHKKVSATLVAEMLKELNAIKKEPDAVFFDAWIQAVGQVF